MLKRLLLVFSPMIVILVIRLSQLDILIFALISIIVPIPGIWYFYQTVAIYTFIVNFLLGPSAIAYARNHLHLSSIFKANVIILFFARFFGENHDRLIMANLGYIVDLPFYLLVGLAVYAIIPGLSQK